MSAPETAASLPGQGPAAGAEAPRKQYSGMSYDGRRTWTVPRWLKEAFVAFAIAAVVAVGASKAVQHFGGPADRAKTVLEADDLSGAPAFPFQLPARGGGTLDLASLKGKLVLVNFWASWCAPCREEEPSLQKLARALEPGTFEVVAISVDDGWAPIEKFFNGAKPAYQVALDQGAVVSQRFGTRQFPESYLLDQRGNLKLKFVGPRNWADPSVVTLLESMGARRSRGLAESG
ncbi:MAG: hypothetical protein NVSMB23_21170 [Myxococcales bacterium]